MTTATDGTAPAPVANNRTPPPLDRAGTEPGRYRALDGLRAFAAFAVLLTHAGDASGMPSKVTHFFGISFPTGIAIQQLNLGVEIFFVISAFLVYRPFIAANVQGNVMGNDHPEPLRFLWKRAWRIYPAYWVALFVIVALFANHSLPNADTALTNAFLTFGYDPKRWWGGGIGLRQSWTLVVEISFYFFIPFWAWATRALGRRLGALRVEIAGALALIVAGPLFLYATRQHNVWTPFRVLPPYLGAFGFGMLFAAIGVWNDGRAEEHAWFSRARNIGLWYWIAALVVFVATIKTFDLSTLAMFVPGSTHQTIERIMHATVAALLVAPIAFGLPQRSVIRKALGNRVVAQVGLWSYGFYLWHYTFIDYMHDHHFDTSSTRFFVKIVIVATIGAVAAGAASWYLIERPCIRLGAGRVARPRWLQWQRPTFFTGLGGITFAALIWRVGYIVASIDRLKLGGDAFYYHTQANDIAHGRWFIDPSQFAWYGRVTPSAGHPPSYLLYLAAVSRFIGQSELTHRLASAVLGAATVFALGMFARKLFDDDRVGWIAAALGAVYAHLWINDEMLMSETMAQLWTVLAFIAIYRCWRDPRRGTAAWMGAAIGLAALSRAEAATLFPLLVIPLLLLMRRLPMRKRISLAALSCVIGGATMAPWLLYNVGRFTHPVLMSNGVGSVLMVANCDRTYGHYPTKPGEDRNAYLGYWSVGCAIDAGFTALQKGDESEKEVEWRKVGLDYIKAHKSEYPEMSVLRVARMWDLGFIGQNIHPFNAELEGRGAWQSTLATMQYLVLLPLGINGLVLLRRRKIPILPFLAVAGTITFTAATTFGITRYRAPVDALLPALAAGAIVARLDRSRRARSSGALAPDALPLGVGSQGTRKARKFRFRAAVQSPTIVFCALAMVLGTGFAALTPALTGYDEGVHLFRAWQLSNGHVRSLETINARGQHDVGDMFPAQLRPDAFALIKDGFYGRDSSGGRDASRAFHHIRDPAAAGKATFEGFPSSAVYPPVPYIPAAIAIRIARTIGLSTFALLFFARLATLLGYILIVGRALHHAPRRRWLLAVLALAPVCTFQAAMLSSDGITIALALLAVALAQRLVTVPRGAIRWPMLLEAGLVVGALGLSKPPYILFAALFVPALWKHRRTRVGSTLLAAMAPGAIAFLLWSKYAQSIYIAPRFEITGAGSYAYRGVDTTKQLTFLAHRPWALFSVIRRTIGRTWVTLLHDMVAQIAGWVSPAALGVTIAVLTYASFAVAITQSGNDSARADLPDLSRFERVVMITIAIVTIFAVFLLAYTGWNQVAAPRIDAFQGRYLFPPLALLALTIPPMRSANRRLQGWFPAVVVTATSVITLVGLTLHYY